MTPTRIKRLSQPTTFGNPRTHKSRRFYRIAGSWLSVVNNVFYWMLVASCMTFVGLIVYVGLFETHSEVYASDGTIFSCHIDTVSVARTQ